jgi:hypothetical protein
MTTAPAIPLTRHTFVVSGQVVHEVTAKTTGGFTTRCRTVVSDALPTVSVVPEGSYCCAACFEPQRSNAR